MVRRTSFAGILLSIAALGASAHQPRAAATSTCQSIAAAISSASDVYYPRKYMLLFFWVWIATNQRT